MDDHDALEQLHADILDLFLLAAKRDRWLAWLARVEAEAEHRMRCARSSSVIDQPTRRAKASGVISRTAPHLHVTRTRKSRHNAGVEGSSPSLSTIESMR
jgi:hypothetical protein